MGDEFDMFHPGTNVTCDRVATCCANLQYTIDAMGTGKDPLRTQAIVDGPMVGESCREIFAIDDGRRVAILVTRRSETFFVQPATCCYTNLGFWSLMKNLMSMYNVDVISMRPLCGWSLSRHMC